MRDEYEWHRRHGSRAAHFHSSSLLLAERHPNKGSGHKPNRSQTTFSLIFVRALFHDAVRTHSLPQIFKVLPTAYRSLASESFRRLHPSRRQKVSLARARTIASGTSRARTRRSPG